MPYSLPLETAGSDASKIAGTLAGAVYAVTMYRTNRLSDPIAAHMSSNAVIAIWAVAAAEWSLL